MEVVADCEDDQPGHGDEAHQQGEVPVQAGCKALAQAEAEGREGQEQDAEPSESIACRGIVREKVRQLRDPAIFREGGETYLLYAVAGEQGIAVARVEEC